MSVPLYGFMEGDTLGVLILSEEEETVAVLAQKLQDAAGIRVKPAAHVELLRGDTIIEPALTVAQAGFTALDRFDVRRART